MVQDPSRFQRGWLFRELIGPGLALAIYCAVLIVVLPDGFNRRFVMVLAFVAFVVVVALGVVGVVSAGLNRNGPRGAGKVEGNRERGYRADAWLLLLPLAPVAQYMVVNRSTLSLLDSVVATTALAAAAVLLALVIPFLAQRALSRSVMMMVGLALSFVMYSMASFSQSSLWYVPENMNVPLAVFAILVVVGVVLYRYRREGAYVIAGGYFVSAAIVSPLISEPPPHALGSAPPTIIDADARDGALATIASGEAGRLPDIILLTYDSYVENETMLQYGIDNADQESFLESQGFEIERGTYTVAGDSMASMGSVLLGSDPGQAVAGDSPLFDALHGAGYETNAVFEHDYLFSRAAPSYDRYSPDPWPVYLTMLRGILEGRFGHAFANEDVPYQEFVETKRSVLAADFDAPQFLYAHGGPGHSQNSGACRDDEVARFESRLASANLEMREDIATVLEHRPEAIVIVSGDHGPYLTKNCVGLNEYGGYSIEEVSRLDIQDRFGSFLAIRWPDDLQPAEDEIEVLQDTLPAVLGEVFPDVQSDDLRGSTRVAEGQERVIAGVNLDHGVIVGGPLDGEPLFEASAD